MVHRKNKEGFSDGEKKQKSVHCSTERIRFIFTMYAVYANKYWKAAGSKREVYTQE